jgi:hypothetical protein
MSSLVYTIPANGRDPRHDKARYLSKSTTCMCHSPYTSSEHIRNPLLRYYRLCVSETRFSQLVE